MKAVKYLLLLTALFTTTGTSAQTTEADSVIQKVLCCGIARNRSITRYEAGGTAGSGDFAEHGNSITEQLERAKARVAFKNKGGKYMAYHRGRKTWM